MRAVALRPLGGRQRMRFAVTLPNLGVADGPARLVDLAVEAEQAGWDGVFFWDTFGSGTYDERFADDRHRRAPWDVWSLLSAVAVRTERVRIGTLVTPVSRRRPWKLAAEAATVDQLSGGRLTLSVGLGWVPDAGFTRAGEEGDRAVRASRLDEGLDVLTALWSRSTVSFDGEHVSLQAFPGVPSVQQPRIPIWVVGAWPRPRSIERALRFDGLLPTVGHRLDGGVVTWLQPTATELEAVLTDLAPRLRSGYDVVAEGVTSRDRDRAAAKVEPFAAAGATWWLENVSSLLDLTEAPLPRMQERIRMGPPPIDR